MVLILGSTLASPGKKEKQLLTIETNIQPQALPQGFWCTWSVMLLKLMRMSFFKEISYYLAPVTLLPYCSQNILHLWGFSTCCQPFSWHSLLLFLRFQLLSVTSEILFYEHAIYTSFTFLPLLFCHKSLLPSIRILTRPSLVTCPSGV